MVNARKRKLKGRFFQSGVGMVALAISCAPRAATADVSPVTGTTQTFSASAPANVFYEDEKVHFTASGSAPTVDLKIQNYNGKVVKEGTFPSGAIELGRLARGYYEIVPTGPAAVRSTSFVVVARPHLRPPGRVATDAALAWLVPPDRYELGSELLQRAGFVWARDRISWNEVESVHGKFAWGRYDRAVDAEAKHGISVCEAFHDVPKWARADGAMNRFPDDLRDAYNFAFAAARHFKGKVKAWEVWNEADIPAFAPDPASEYAAFLKATYLGFKAADSALPVTQVSFALAGERFAPALALNETRGYYDIFNYHIYDDPANYARRADAHQAQRADTGTTDRPVWLTEAGIPLHTTEGLVSEEDRRRQAEFIPRSYAEALAHGVDKHFFFLFPHYVENGSEFGVLNADFTPAPGYAALATTTEALGAARYLGEITYRQPGLHVHVFDNGEGETVLAWSDKSNVIVPLPLSPEGVKKLATLQVLDVVGAPTRLDADVHNHVPHIAVSPSPVFVRLPHGALTEALHLPVTYKETHPAHAVKPATLAHIVVRLRLLEAKADKGLEAFRISGSGPIAVEAQVYNFGKQSFTGTLAFTSPPGWTLNRSQIPISKLAPMGRDVEAVSLTASSTGGETKPLAAHVLEDRGEQSSPAVVNVLVD